MQLSDLTSKTPEELNRILAELLGWSDFKYEQIWAEHPNDRYDAWTARQPDMIGACACEIPDYCGSYDAVMPEVRKLLERPERDHESITTYRLTLRDIIAKRMSLPMDHPIVSNYLAAPSPIELTIALILTLHP